MEFSSYAWETHCEVFNGLAAHLKSRFDENENGKGKRQPEALNGNSVL